MTKHDKQTAGMIAIARSELAATLAGLCGAERIAAARRACDTCGGSMIAPRLPWGPQEHEISLLGIMASGADEATAVAEWIKTATRCTEETSA